MSRFIPGGRNADEITDPMDPSNRLRLPAERQIPRPERPRADGAPSAEPPIEAGTEIGDFLVTREIGRSTMAFILEARQRSRERLVALKVLSPSLTSSPLAVARFRAEAALARRVVHPGLVPVLCEGTNSGLVFYAMALVEGPTLAKFIEGAMGTRGEMFFREAALRFADLALTVEALHRSGILHRKIHPSNIVLDGDRFLLSDFELAMDLSAHPGGGRPEDQLELRGPVPGRIYSAPEEFVGGAGLDPRADIYSLGMCLYELATGILPFPKACGQDLARLKLTRRPIPPRRLNPEVPLGLEAVIRQAIEANPTLRHSSAGELARDLERLGAGKRGPTRRHQPLEGSPDDEQGSDPLPDAARIA